MVEIQKIPNVRCTTSSAGAWLRVSGEDALSFLQGQFTQDLLRTSDGGVAYGLWLNQKGKALADSWALRVGPREVWLWSTASSGAVIRERLEGYIIADDVTVEDFSAEAVTTRILGPGAEAWAAAQAGEIPASGAFRRIGDGFLFRERLAQWEAWVWVGRGVSAPAEGLERLSEESLRRARIAAGVVSVPDDLGPDDLPQEGGLETVAVSFNKGCYLGQEVMARLQSMGRVRRRLLRVSGPGAPARGAGLFQGARQVGALRTVAADGAQGFIAWAMVNLTGFDVAAGLSLDAGGPAAVALMDQP